MNARELLPLILAVSTLVACRSSGDTPARIASRPAASPTRQASPIAAQATLDAMDRRTPVPLLPMMANHQKQNMRDHLLVVQEIIAAVAAKDFDAVQSSVSRIGYSEQMGRMCEHMGAGAPGFTELALQFHHTADRIGDAARAHDSDGTLKALGDTLAMCTSCHRTYRQQVVDDAAWTTLANAPPRASSVSR